MDIEKFKKRTEPWKPLILLESSFSKEARNIVKKVLLIIIVFSTLGMLGLINIPSHLATGLFLLSLVLYSIISLFDSLYFSYYSSNTREKAGVGFHLSLFLNTVGQKDMISSFFKSFYFGKDILKRCEIDEKDFEDFLSNRKTWFIAGNLSYESITRLPNLVEVFFDKDKEFKDFLLKHSVTKEDISGATNWVTRTARKEAESKRWWAKEKLENIKGIGENLSYGNIFTLRRHSIPISVYGSFSGDSGLVYYKEELGLLETTLEKNTQSNAILVGDDKNSLLDIVKTLKRKIATENIGKQLFHKHIVILDGSGLIASHGTKTDFENELITLLNETISAGNIILVIPDFPQFIDNASIFGSDVPGLLDPYLASSGTQIIVTSDIANYYSHIENNKSLASRFEKIQVKEGDNNAVLAILEETALSYEKKGKVFFSYLAISEISKSVSRYFSSDFLLPKSLDMLSESIPFVRQKGSNIISREKILLLTESKTGIPTSEVSQSEKTKLLNLEGVLHKRIIGQEEAVVSISNAMRRTRSGIGNPNRPIGSFLFIGPTGVGKTETTKALAEAFFGQSAKILRLDMSEYNSSDALNRLIGFAGENDGILSTMIRENQYGVLLLDEFEKTDKKVLDLFLQILDEGIFSDAQGKKVNARNLIIIATSNAGSDIIFNLVKTGENLKDKKDFIVDSIIDKNIFKPELINRFDGVILFHPLTDNELTQIAKLMLNKLNDRLKLKGVELDINENIIGFLVKQGSDPKFGARPLNRVIQEKIEGYIAKKMLSGDIKAGTKVIITEQELTQI